MPIGDIPKAPLTFGEPSVPAAVGGPVVQPKNGAGLWGLVASQAANLDQMKAAGPASTAAVVAQSGTADPAVFGSSTTGNGIRGTSTSAQGIFGHSTNQVGVYGESDNFDGVYGFTKNPNAAGVSGHNPNGLAGFFEGNLTVTGDVILPGAPMASLLGIIQQLQSLVQFLTYQNGPILVGWTPPIVPPNLPPMTVGPASGGHFTINGFGFHSGNVRIVFKDPNGTVVVDKTLPASAFVFDSRNLNFETINPVDLGPLPNVPSIYHAANSGGVWTATGQTQGPFSP